MLKKKDIQIKLTNRWLYTFITIGILAILGAGVYAYNSGGPASFVGHSHEEIEPCADGQILQTSGTSWECVDALGGVVEVDPTVLASVKDGITWSEIGSIPAGFLDGIDDLGDHIATQVLHLNNNKITNLATPTSNTDAATKGYVDALGGGSYTIAYIDNYHDCNAGGGWTEINSGTGCTGDILDGEIFCCEPGSIICYARRGTNIYSSITSDFIYTSGWCTSGQDWAFCCK